MLVDVIITLRILVEIALFALIGQGVLYMLTGESREQNMFYMVLKTIASPAMRFTRWLAPKFVVDQHVGWIALFLLALLWLGLAVAKQIVGAVELG
ncbi:MAG TPA: hypothetical protein VFP62_02440 [Burkholderiales bacterium]|jgi:hypothetical protein|nr:hypothetical protein [Burkholderiales bacterium]